MRDEVHEMRQFVKMAAAAANGELRDALLALERDLEVVKKKVNGGLLACIGADVPSITGMARQQDLLEVSNSVGTKVDRGELQVGFSTLLHIALNVLCIYTPYSVAILSLQWSAFGRTGAIGCTLHTKQMHTGHSEEGSGCCS